MDDNLPDVLARLIRMLGLIPRAGRGKVSAPELKEKLTALGFQVSIRSVQRDLQKLSGPLDLQNDGAKPAGWSYKPHARPLVPPALGEGDALTLYLVERYVAPVLPRHLLRELRPRFEEAQRVLDHRRPEGSWVRRVATLPSWQPLLPPDVPADVIDVVYESLLRRRRFEVEYRSSDSRQWRRHQLSPLGLVNRDGVLYSVATAWDYRDARQWALHRMRKAAPSKVPLVEPPGFTLERYIAEGEFDWPVGGRPVHLKLKVDSWVARQLQDRRLSQDQKIVFLKDEEHARVIATVKDTEQLRWWILSFGDSIEVQAPRPLRDAVARRLRAAVQPYKKRRLARKPAPTGREP